MRMKTNLNAAGDAPMTIVMSREGIGLPNRYQSFPLFYAKYVIEIYLHIYANALQFYTIPFQVDMLRDRSRNYLIMHLILGGAIFGISLAILGKICVSISYSYNIGLYFEMVNTIFNVNKNLFQECSSISQQHLSL